MITPSGSGSATDIPTSEKSPLLVDDNIATRAHREILNNNNKFFQPHSFIFWFSYGGAAFLAAIPAVLYLGLSEDDFKSGAKRYLFATASFGVNYVQVSTVQQITLSHYLENFKSFAMAIRDGNQGVRQLLQIHRGSRTRSKIYVATKSVFGFLFREGLKWTILFYASMLPPSLAKEVSWLNNKIYKKALRASIIIFLQEAVHERIKNFRPPAFMPDDIVREEVVQFQKVILSLLKLNQHDSMDNRNEHEADVNYILQTQENKGLLTRALNISRHCNHTNLLSSNVTNCMGTLITLLLTTVYSAANSGNYSETYSNLADPIEGRVGSIFVDFLFGLYMAIETGPKIAYHLRRFKAVIRHHKRELLCLAVTLLISGCTVGSTLAVANEQGMPRFIKVLTVPGTMFDNANFLFLLFFYTMSQCRRKNDRVKLQRFYNRFHDHIASLSPTEFLDYIRDVSIVEGNFLDGYEDEIRRRMRWTQNLTVSEVINTLCKSPRNAANIISQGGRYGLLRRTEELFASLFTMSFCLLRLIPSSCENVRTVLDYICPTVSIPMGVISMSLFGHCRSRKRKNEIRDPLSDTLVEKGEISNEVVYKESTTVSLLSLFLSSIIPIGLGFSTRIISHWVYEHVFHQSNENAIKASEYTTAAITAIGSALVTKSITVGMR